MTNDKFIFFRTAWMKKYQGKTDDDIPIGGGSYVQDNEDGGEVLNFKSLKGQFYPYVRLKGNIRIEKLGAGKTEESIDGVTIIVFAQDPRRGGEYVVGWYKSAYIFRELRSVTGYREVKKKNLRAMADVKSSHLIPPHNRKFLLPKKAAGHSNIWYGNPDFIRKVKNYIKNYSEKSERIVTKPQTRGSWQPDIEKRKKIEMAAMGAVNDYYYKDDADLVKYVHSEKLGWDLEAIYGSRKLLVEVKGLQAKLNTVELTANEYKQAKTNKKDFRLCVVTHALEPKNKKVHEFKYTGKNGEWQSVGGEIMNTQVIKSARLML
jgi:hypothetical protein